jgi:hypothetical protein
MLLKKVPTSLSARTQAMAAAVIVLFLAPDTIAGCSGELSGAATRRFSRIAGERGGIFQSLLTEQPRATLILSLKLSRLISIVLGMMEQRVEDGGGQHLIAEHFSPIDETLVGSDDEPGALVAARYQKRRDRAFAADGQMAQLVDY